MRTTSGTATVGDAAVPGCAGWLNSVTATATTRPSEMLQQCYRVCRCCVHSAAIAQLALVTASTHALMRTAALGPINECAASYGHVAGTLHSSHAGIRPRADPLPSQQLASTPAGKEGARKNYSANTCTSLVQAMGGPADHHGCPFKRMDEANLRAALARTGCAHDTFCRAFEGR